MRQILNNFGLGSLERAIRACSGFMTAVIVARSYAISEFAEYAYFSAILMTMLQLVKLGSDDIIAKTANRSILKIRGYFILKSVFAILLSFSIFTFIALHKDPSLQIYIFVCAAVIISPTQTLITIYQARGDFLRPLKCTLLALALSNLIKIILVLITEIPATYLALLDPIFISVSALKLVDWRTVKLLCKKKLRKQDLAPCLKITFPLFISSICISLYARVDIFMLTWLSSSVESASYFAITRITEAFTFLLPILNILFIRSWNKYDSNNYKTMFKIGYKASSMAVLMVAAFSYAGGLGIFGSEYEKLQLELVLASLSIIPITLGSISNIWLINNNLSKYKVVRTFCGLLFNIILNLILIPYYGMVGAIVATLCSQLLASVFFNVLNVKTQPLLKQLLLLKD